MSIPMYPVSREYRKGNWTIEETLTLITAKKLNETTAKSSKLRWNWIEEYCWAHGCYRSQNQCNDKWDNLLRDYKKVRRYQQSITSESSYWTLERHQRKLLNLPSNMSPEVCGYKFCFLILKNTMHDNDDINTIHLTRCTKRLMKLFKGDTTSVIVLQPWRWRKHHRRRRRRCHQVFLKCFIIFIEIVSFSQEYDMCQLQTEHFFFVLELFWSNLQALKKTLSLSVWRIYYFSIICIFHFSPLTLSFHFTS